MIKCYSQSLFCD